MKRNIIFIIIGFLILNLTLGLFVFHFVSHRAFVVIQDVMDGNYFNQRVIRFTERRLHLSDNQRARVAELKKIFDKQMQPHRATIHTLRYKLKEVLFSDSLNEKKARGILEEISAERNEILFINIKFKFEIQKVLNPRQRNEMKEIFKRIQKKFQKATSGRDANG